MRTKHFSAIYSILAILLLPFASLAAGPANDDCSSLSTTYKLTSTISCSMPSGNTFTVTNATASAGATGCVSGTHWDVWFYFVAVSSVQSVTIGNFGNKVTNPEVEIVSTCGATTTLACGTTNAIATGLTVGATYYVRVSQVGGTSPNAQGSFDICLSHPPTNDACSGAVAITPGTTCSSTRGELYLSTNEGLVTSTCNATTNDVWYKFTVPAGASVTSISVTMDAGITATSTNTYVEVFDATSCGTITTANSLGCLSVASATSLALTPGNTYYYRVYTTADMRSGSGPDGFSTCVTYATAPANDDCSGAVSLTPNAACSNTAGTLAGATASSLTSTIPLGCFTSGTYYDVWYKFQATQAAHVITLSSLGTNVSGAQIQVFSGACGSLTSLACGTGAVTATSLTAGQFYYVRVANTTAASTLATFNICVTSPTLAKVDYSRSYINVSKGTSGGTVDPGDTLEMRFTMVVSSLSVDSLSILDTIYNGKGFRLVPGSIALRTNEGKIYGNGGNAFTDAFDSDQGWYSVNGSDTVIHLNFGTGASNYARGALSSTSRPSVFNSTCIIMATYRVIVNAPYNTLINFRTGSMTYRDKTASAFFNLTFPSDNLMVYSSPGLCPNATSATNALSAAESNGTFGSPSPTTAPLARNRTTTATLIGSGYSYMPFNSSGGPNDYYYGIVNNTSSAYTTSTTLAKPDAAGNRVFKLWDITGDHGGSSTSAGSVPCDTTKAVNASTNPCGYMLVVNSAYRADTAFTYNVTGLCPNTYYEISAWFKNICYKCGCDSTGTSSTTAGYIPSATGDSSGVQPNIAFDVNGVDYYTTGNLKYQGLGSGANAQINSDGLNVWQKRGFVYLTGSSQTSFTLTLRNNAPGGGGNDWALDDIAVKNCLPNMQYSPSTNPTACMNNPLTINDTVRSYFNNYNYYKWQKSTDGGTTWTDISGASGTTTPAWNGSAYQFITSYTIPNTNTTLANANDKYRVVVATTSSNITSSSCSTTDGVSIIALAVQDCTSVLDTKFTSFNGKLVASHGRLSWTTTRIDQPIRFELEKSLDGSSFKVISNLNGPKSASESNSFSALDSVLFTGKAYYRVAMVAADGRKQYSSTIQLNDKADNFLLANVVNPFESVVYFDLSVNADSKIEASLLNAAGAVIRQQSYSVSGGVNSLAMNNLDQLAPGIYVLQIRNNENVITRKLIKK